MEFACSFFHDPTHVVREESGLRWRAHNTFIDFYTSTKSSAADAKQRLRRRSTSMDGGFMTSKPLHESDEADESDDFVCTARHSNCEANINSRSGFARVHDMWSDPKLWGGSGVHGILSDQVKCIGSDVHDINQSLLVNEAITAPHLVASCATYQRRNIAAGNILANIYRKNQGYLKSRLVHVAAMENISTSHLFSSGATTHIDNLAVFRDACFPEMSSQQQAQTKQEDLPAPTDSSAQLVGNPPLERCADKRHVHRLFATQLKKLENEDDDRIIVMKKINRLGYNSANLLKNHYKQTAPISEVHFTQTQDKQVSCPSIRVRPSPMAFVVFESAQGASLVLARGERQHVGGKEIIVRPFIKTPGRHSSAHNDDGNPDPR